MYRVSIAMLKNTRNIISFPVHKISFIILIVPVDFFNDRNTMHRVI